MLWLERQIACGLALALAMPVGWAATDPLPSAPAPQVDLRAQADQSQAASQPQATQNGQQAPAEHPNQPVGTAVAPVVKPEGAPASRPAGAAIAPMKQRRTRAFTIRLALIVGAAVAVGTVAGVTLASPARPH
jgi:hypothetical protein